MEQNNKFDLLVYWRFQILKVPERENKKLKGQANKNKKNQFKQQYNFLLPQIKQTQFPINIYFIKTMNSDHYMDKLRTIREKYGCSQSNKTPFMHRSSYADKLNPETTFNDRKKIMDKSSDISSYTNIQNKISVAAGTPYSYNTPFGINQVKKSRRNDSERQIEEIRESYANTRQKIIEGYPRESLRENGRTYSRQVMDRDINLQKYYKTPENYGNYIRDRASSYAPEEQSSSPIKKMKDFPESKATRLRENSVGNSNPDGYWREREARLSELTSNRLCEMKSSKMNESYSKNPSLTKVQDYQKPVITSPTRIPSSYRENSQNRKSDYTVSKIQNIQNRIQSILGSRQ